MIRQRPMRAAPRRALAVLLAAAVSWVTGCAARPPAAADLAIESTRDAREAFVLARAIPWAVRERGNPSPLEEQTDSQSWQSRFEVIDGPEAPGVLVMTRRTGPSPGTWLITRQFEGDADPQEEQTLALDAASGALMQEAMVNHARGVHVELRPAAIAAPARIEPGQTIAREMTLRLPLIENTRRLREKGTGLSEVTLVDEQRLRTAAGAFDALHLREVFTSRLSAATAVRTIDRWYAPGRGLIAEQWSEEVKVLGVVVERSRQAIRVLPPGG